MDVTDIQIALARLEEVVTAGFARVEEKFEEFAQRQDALETTGKRQASEALKLAAKVEVLDGHRRRALAFARWTAGILGVVVGALILAKLGLKP